MNIINGINSFAIFYIVYFDLALSNEHHNA